MSRVGRFLWRIQKVLRLMWPQILPFTFILRVKSTRMRSNSFELIYKRGKCTTLYSLSLTHSISSLSPYVQEDLQLNRRYWLIAPLAKLRRFQAATDFFSNWRVKFSLPSGAIRANISWAQSYKTFRRLAPLTWLSSFCKQTCPCHQCFGIKTTDGISCVP